MYIKLRGLVMAGIVSIMTACSSAGQNAQVLPPVSPQNSVANSHVDFSIVIPAVTTSSQTRSPMYISPGTKSASISVTSGSSAPQTSTTNCTTACTFSLAVPIGTDAFVVTLYNAVNGGGTVLSKGSVTVPITAGGMNNVGVSLGGVIASFGVTLSPATVTKGVASSISVAVTPLDANGNSIIGSIPFNQPITISSNDPALSPSTQQITTPGQTVTLAYNGSSAFSGATITASTPAVKSSVSAALGVVQPLVNGINFTTAWVGNTFGGANNQWVQDSIQGATVASNGTLFANTGWDEGGHEITAYQNDTITGAGTDTHGWGRSGTAAIANDGTYVYAGIVQSGCQPGAQTGLGGVPSYPSCGTSWNAIVRYGMTLGASITTPGGDGYNGGQVIVSSGPSGSNLGLRSLAVGSGRLYVSDPQSNQIEIYSTTTFSKLASISIPSPGPLALDQNGRLWAVSNGTTVLAYDASGNPLPQQISLAAGVIPSGLCVDPTNNLIVTDNGPDQNLKIFGSLSSTPVLSGTFGTTGGVFAGSDGTVGPGRLDGPVGCGFDANGVLYIAMSAQQLGAQVDAYVGSSRVWSVYGHAFVDGAGMGPLTGDIFTSHSHYTDTLAMSGQEGTWVGETLDPFKYPDDPRLHIRNCCGTVVRSISGRRFAFLSTQTGTELAVYRFSQSGEIAVPAAFFMSQSSNGPSVWPAGHPSGGWDWRDTSGTGTFATGQYEANPETGSSDTWGFYVDAAGTVWKPMTNGAIRSYPVQGLDAIGNPIYHFANSKLYEMPAPITTPMRVAYASATDTMYVGGFAAGQSDGGCWGSVGETLARYDTWSTSPALRWSITLPFTCSSGLDPKVLDTAGNLVFVGYVRSSAVDVYDANTGIKVGTLSPGASVGSASGEIDETNGLTAEQITPTTYDVFVEEDWHNKVIVYHVTTH